MLNTSNSMQNQKLNFGCYHCENIAEKLIQKGVHKDDAAKYIAQTVNKPNTAHVFEAGKLEGELNNIGHLEYIAQKIINDAKKS